MKLRKTFSNFNLEVFLCSPYVCSEQKLKHMYSTISDEQAITTLREHEGATSRILERITGIDKSCWNIKLFEMKNRGIVTRDNNLGWYLQDLSGSSDENGERDRAKDIIENTDRHLVLLGRAGSGKTTLLKEILDETKKRIAVIAPSGIAAKNAEGKTIHSFFRFDTMPYTPGQSLTTEKIPYSSREAIRMMDTIIIDEISMVRADLLDRVDATLREIRQDGRPFGGVQMIFVGDLRQLPPVLDENEVEECKAMATHYPDGIYFFNSRVMQDLDYDFIELQHIYRQQGDDFKHILNRVRDNKILYKDIEAINGRYKPAEIDNCNSDSIYIVTHKKQAYSHNKKMLDKLHGKTYKFEASFSKWYGDWPADRTLYLKVGAHVIFLKNKDGEYCNGDMGVVTDIDEYFETVTVRMNDSGRLIEVERDEWTNYEYIFDEQTKKLEVRGYQNFEQIPLGLGWAITVHKSQGLTFDKVMLNTKRSFAEGQAYVALSRCRSLDGITMISQFKREQVFIDSRVDEWLLKQRRED